MGTKGERLNAGPFQPVGTLAAGTFQVSGSEGIKALRGQSFVSQLAAVYFATRLSPLEDLRRMLAASPHWSLLSSRTATLRAQPGSPLWRSRRRWAQRCLRELPDVRRVSEALAGPPRGSSQSRVSHVVALQQRLARRTVRWVGLGDQGDQEVFRTTPAGAVLLSALFGVYRGGLGVCKDCAAFMVSPRGRWPAKLCARCRSLADPRVKGLGDVKDRWRRIQQRMRRRGFKRMGLLTRDDQDTWRRYALQRLREVQSAQALDAWEKEVAPKGRPGRPRKSGRATGGADRSHGPLPPGGRPPDPRGPRGSHGRGQDQPPAAAKHERISIVRNVARISGSRRR